MNKKFCKVGLFLLRKHWVKEDVVTQTPEKVWKDQYGNDLKAEFPTEERYVLECKDFAEGYFFPRLAIKLLISSVNFEAEIHPNRPSREQFNENLMLFKKEEEHAPILISTSQD